MVQVGDTLLFVDIEAAVERLKVLSDVKSVNGVADVVGVTSAGLHSAIKRGELPYKAIINTAVNLGWSLDEIFGINVKQASPLDRGTENEQRKTSVRVDSHSTLNDAKPTDVVMNYYADVEYVLNQYLGPKTETFKKLGPERAVEIRAKLFKVLFEQALKFDGNRAILDALARSTLSIL